MFALCDCDSFFASCERVFRPDLYGKPVVVLSNNDGCIVAMTKEAKALGLKRGIPFFQVKDICLQSNVAVFSGNYTLYGDISSRVMRLLAEEMGDIEVYSIDECFFSVEGLDSSHLHEALVCLRNKIYKGIGIPVSIGVAQTRTLAKMASHFAKQYSGYNGVCIIDSEEKRTKALKLFPINDIWGIGRQHAKKLKYHGINSAYQFICKSESWVRAQFHSPGVDTWKELCGIPSKNADDMEGKQSICTSRSFGLMVSDYNQLAESISNFTSLCAIKLRKQHSFASAITVFLFTNRHREDMQQYMVSKTINLPIPTAYTSELIKYSLMILKEIFKSGFQYKKSGVILTNISSDKVLQQHLFDENDRTKQIQISKVIDNINRNYGNDTLKLAVQFGSEGQWNAIRNYKSPNYTTNINEIITVKAN